MVKIEHPISVMIVDDHPLFRAGLQRALEFETDLLIAGISGDGEEALIMAKSLKPRVILLDINLPRMNGLQVARQLHLQDNPPAVVILTAHHDDEQVIYAFSMGASAYCTKDVHPEHLVNTIRGVAQGYFVNGDNQRLTKQQVSEWLQHKINANKGVIDEQGQLAPLSSREMEILRYVTKGYLNKEIALKLSISQQTVKNHITSILKKLNVKDRTQAAVTALQRGWVRLNELSQQEA